MSDNNLTKANAVTRHGAFLTLATAVAATGIVLHSVADQTVSTDTTLTESVSGKLTIENGAAVRIGENLTVGSYAINSGTLTVAAGKTFRATDSASNYLGVDTANEGSYGHTGNVGAIVLEENAVMEDTSNNGVHLFTSRLGSEAQIVVGSGARLNLDWKYIKANGNTSNENRNRDNKLVLDLSGQMTVGEILTMDWFYNGGASGNPRSWPTNMVVNLHQGGTLSIRSIQNSYDTAQSVFNFDGGTLKFRWDSNFLHDGNPPADFHFAAGSRGVLNTDGHNVNLTSANRIFLSGGGAMVKSGNGTLTINPAFCDSSDFTGDIYLTGGTLNFPIVADGVARKVYFQGGALAVPENGTFVTVANGGSVEFVSVDGADIKLVSNGNAKIANNGTPVRCSGTGKPVFEGTFAPGGEIQRGSSSDSMFGVSLPAGVAYGKVGSGTDTLAVNGLSSVNIHEGKLRTGKFRFWRMVFDDNAGTGNGVQLCELGLYEDPDGDGNATRIEPENRDWTVSSHSTWGNQDENVEKLFDGGTSKFLSFDGFYGNADIIIEFPEPREIRAYQWWTADDCLDPNNGDCRTPTAWHWLASTDGENWIEVARVPDFNPTTSDDDPAKCATNKWTLAGTWWLDYEKTHLPNPLASSTITIDSGASLLIDKAEAVKVGNIVNNGGAVELSVAGATLNLVGGFGTRALSGGGITGLGGIVKSGSGTTCATGVNTYSGDTVVAGGTYAVVTESSAAPKYFRFTFQNSGGASQFAWLKLCSADGSIQSTGLTEANVGTAAASLSQGTYSRTTDFSQWGGEGIANVFDESPDTKFGGSANGEIVMRLPDSAKRIATFDVMSGGDDNPYTDRRLEYFKLEASLDGNTWQTVSEVDVTDQNAVNRAWYSGGSGFLVRMPGDASTVADATIPAGSTVQVKPGATLAVETAMTISKLRIDLDDEKDVVENSATPGTIAGFKPAANGTLELVYTGSEPLGNEVTLGLDFESIDGLANETLKTWSCTLNGQSSKYRLVTGEGARNSKLVMRPHLMIMVY